MAANETNTKLIVDAIREGAKRLEGDYQAIKTAQGVVDTAGAAQTSTRRGIMTSMVALAIKHKFTADDIDQGRKDAVAAFKSIGLNAMSEKTYENFASEVKVAMHPAVRDNYAVVCTLAQDAFKGQKPTPDNDAVRQAYKREALMVNSLASAMAKGTATPPKAMADVVKIAKARNTANVENFAKCRGQIKRISEALTAANTTFPLAAFDKMLALCDELAKPGTLENALLAVKAATPAAKPGAKVRKGTNGSAKGASDVAASLDELNA